VVLHTAYNQDVITDSDWHHIAVCKVGTEYGVYKDGRQVGYANSLSALDITGLLYIGQRGDDGNMFNGNMDEVRIYHGNPLGALPDSSHSDTIEVPAE
jgi:hypothetical protein